MKSTTCIPLFCNLRLSTGCQLFLRQIIRLSRNNFLCKSACYFDFCNLPHFSSQSKAPFLPLLRRRKWLDKVLRFTFKVERQSLFHLFHMVCFRPRPSIYCFTLPMVEMNILEPVSTVKTSFLLPQRSANSGPITTAGSGASGFSCKALT